MRTETFSDGEKDFETQSHRKEGNYLQNRYFVNNFARMKFEGAVFTELNEKNRYCIILS